MIRQPMTSYATVGCGSGWAVCCMSRTSTEFCGADGFWLRDVRLIGSLFETEDRALAFISLEARREDER